MTGALIILGVTVAVGLLLYLTRDKNATQPDDRHGDTALLEEDDESEDDAMQKENLPYQTCCGRHAVCEKELPTTEELYYNDEELDRYIGREPESYTLDEIEEFRDVLYTLRPDEVYPWGMALTQRNIPLPLPLRDEWILLTRP